jgi:hypothetical protein
LNSARVSTGIQWLTVEMTGCFLQNDIKTYGEQNVGLMDEHKFDLCHIMNIQAVRGNKGLGNQRRCKPLGRDDALYPYYWIESSKADINRS